VANTEDTDKTNKPKGSYSVSSVNKKTPGRPTITVPLPTVPTRFKNADWKRLSKPRQWSNMTVLIVFVLIALVFGYGGALLENSHNTNTGGVTFASLGKQEKVVTSQSQLINQIAKSVGPSVLVLMSVLMNLVQTLLPLKVVEAVVVVLACLASHNQNRSKQPEQV